MCAESKSALQSVNKECVTESAVGYPLAPQTSLNWLHTGQTYPWGWRALWRVQAAANARWSRARIISDTNHLASFFRCLSLRSSVNFDCFLAICKSPSLLHTVNGRHFQCHHCALGFLHSLICTNWSAFVR